MQKFSIISCLLIATINLVASKVIDLNENNWEDLLEGEWVVKLWVNVEINCGFFFLTWDWLKWLTMKIIIGLFFRLWQEDNK